MGWKATEWARIDDMDGTEGATQITFGLEGKAYVIDLSRDNAADLIRTLEPYVAVARSYADLPEALDNGEFQPVAKEAVAALPAENVAPAATVREISSGRKRGKGRKAAQGLGSAGSAPSQAAVRVWALEQGYEGVNARGRLPRAIMEAYSQAQG